MGSMGLELYKKIVDEVEGNIEFLSLASRGEPLVCRDFTAMMEYSIGKFLNLKVNTNASLMTEAHCHALLCGGARTIVFSADAAEEPLYSQLRVNGKLDRVLRNIERFQNIRETQYSSSSVISRVSGVSGFCMVRVGGNVGFSMVFVSVVSMGAVTDRTHSLYWKTILKSILYTCRNPIF